MTRISIDTTPYRAKYNALAPDNPEANTIIHLCDEIERLAGLLVAAKELRAGLDKDIREHEQQKCDRSCGAWTAECEKTMDDGKCKPSPLPAQGELKPCPFCGDTKYFINKNTHDRLCICGAIVSGKGEG